MNAADINEFLETNKVEVQNAVKARIIEGLLSQHRWEISGEVAKAVQDFVAAEVMPEVKKYLQEQKGPIVQAALAGAAEIGENIAKALAMRAAKNLTHDSYQFRAVMKAVFE